MILDLTEKEHKQLICLLGIAKVSMIRDPRFSNLLNESETLYKKIFI